MIGNGQKFEAGIMDMVPASVIFRLNASMVADCIPTN
jgi:hypothetical protein